MVRPVDQRHVDVGFRQNSADVDTPETSADHNDFGAFRVVGLSSNSGTSTRSAGAQGLLQSILDCTEVCL